jgi:hypothetical protein
VGTRRFLGYDISHRMEMITGSLDLLLFSAAFVDHAFIYIYTLQTVVSIAADGRTGLLKAGILKFFFSITIFLCFPFLGMISNYCECWHPLINLHLNP